MKKIISFFLCIIIFLNSLLFSIGSVQAESIIYAVNYSNGNKSFTYFYRKIQKIQLVKNTFKKENCTFKGWRIYYVKNNTKYYYGYNDKGKLGWYNERNISVFYIYTNKQTLKKETVDYLIKKKEVGYIYLEATWVNNSKIINDKKSTWKGFERMDLIKNKKTLNYKITHSKNTKTDRNGIRYIIRNNKRYHCVALGTYYGQVGGLYDVFLSKHKLFKVVMADEKGNDAHHKSNGETDYHYKEDVDKHEYIEIIIKSKKKLNEKVKKSGNFASLKMFAGQVKGMSYQLGKY